MTSGVGKCLHACTSGFTMSSDTLLCMHRRSTMTTAHNLSMGLSNDSHTKITRHLIGQLKPVPLQSHNCKIYSREHFPEKRYIQPNSNRCTRFHFHRTHSSHTLYIHAPKAAQAKICDDEKKNLFLEPDKLYNQLY